MLEELLALAGLLAALVNDDGTFHTTTFLMKHKLSGKYICPTGFDKDRYLLSYLHVKSGSSNCDFKMDAQDDYWGYIMYNRNGWVIHPRGGELNPEKGTVTVMHPSRHAGAWWALDQANDRIIHKGGQFIHPQEGYVASPSEGDALVVHPDQHEGMNWKFVSPSNAEEEVLPYGHPMMIGDWKVFFVLLNAKVAHTYVKEATIGKSKTESTEYTFTYKWEASGGISVDIFSASVSQSIEFMMKTASSSTWYDEIKETVTISVARGQSVVTWQYVFEATQNNHNSVFKSNIFADTSDESVKPRPLNGTYMLK